MNLELPIQVVLCVQQGQGREQSTIKHLDLDPDAEVSVRGYGPEESQAGREYCLRRFSVRQRHGVQNPTSRDDPTCMEPPGKNDLEQQLHRSPPLSEHTCATGGMASVVDREPGRCAIAFINLQNGTMRVRCDEV